MDAIYFPETFVSLYEINRRHIAEKRIHDPKKYWVFGLSQSCVLIRHR
jgi:hypothetical protein